MQDSNLEKFIPYIGLQYEPSARGTKSIDCWGLIVLLYAELYNIHLPRFESTSLAKDGSENTAGFILSTDLYKKCQRVNIDDAKEADLILLTNAGRPTHIGLVIDNQHMIHCFDKAGSLIESYRSLKWNKRIQSIYRHPHFI